MSDQAGVVADFTTRELLFAAGIVPVVLGTALPAPAGSRLLAISGLLVCAAAVVIPTER